MCKRPICLPLTVMHLLTQVFLPFIRDSTAQHNTNNINNQKKKLLYCAQLLRKTADSF